MVHECPKCSRSFSRKSHVDVHLRKIKQCSPSNSIERRYDELQSRLATLEAMMTTGNVQIGNGNSIHNEVHIHINNFGHDDNTFLTLEDIKEVAQKELGDILAEYIRKVNCSAEHKENHNLKLEGDLAVVYSDGSWKSMEKTAALKSFHQNKKKELVELNQSDRVEQLPCTLRSRLEFIAEDDDRSAARRDQRAIERLIKRR